MIALVLSVCVSMCWIEWRVKLTISMNLYQIAHLCIHFFYCLLVLYESGWILPEIVVRKVIAAVTVVIATAGWLLDWLLSLRTDGNRMQCILCCLAENVTPRHSYGFDFSQQMCECICSCTRWEWFLHAHYRLYLGMLCEHVFFSSRAHSRL